MADEQPLEELEAEICELAGHLAAAECRWMLLLEEFDRREGWAGWGVQSCAHWVAWKCGLSLGAARERVRVARRLPGLPRIAAAFGRGELSFAKVRALTRVATPGREAALLDAARQATTPQLERIVRALRPVLTREGELAATNHRHETRLLRWHFDDDGSLVLRARLSPEDGAVLVAALEEAREAAPVPGGVSMETSSPETSWADALVLVARAALASETQTNAPERCQVMVMVEEPVLAGTAEEGACHLDQGPALAPETARRLACDAATVQVLNNSLGNVLDIGRRSRVIPTPLRRALRRRDGGCRYPGCSSRRFVDGHHVRHWAQGGPTSLENLLLLCRRHHRLVHEGGAHVIPGGRTGTFDFFRRDGRPIPACPAPATLSGPGVTARHDHAGLGISATTTRARGEGQPFDLRLAVEYLLQSKEIERLRLGKLGQECLAAAA